MRCRVVVGRCGHFALDVFSVFCMSANLGFVSASSINHSSCIRLDCTGIGFCFILEKIHTHRDFRVCRWASIMFAIRSQTTF